MELEQSTQQLMAETTALVPRAAEMEDGAKPKLVQLSEAANVVVDSAESYEFAAGIVLEAKAAIKEREDFIAPLKKLSHALWKAHCDIETRMKAPFVAIIDKVAPGMKRYATEQDRIRREEEAKRRAEAEAKQEEERKRLEAGAAEAEAAGLTEMAEILSAGAANIIVTPEPVEPVVEKTTHVSGGSVSVSGDVEVQITNLHVFLKAMLADDKFPVPEDAIKKAILSHLKRWAKLHKVASFPGLAISRTVNPRFMAKKGA